MELVHLALEGEVEVIVGVVTHGDDHAVVAGEDDHVGVDVEARAPRAALNSMTAKSGVNVSPFA